MILTVPKVFLAFEVHTLILNSLTTHLIVLLLQKVADQPPNPWICHLHRNCPLYLSKLERLHLQMPWKKYEKSSVIILSLTGPILDSFLDMSIFKPVRQFYSEYSTYRTKFETLKVSKMAFPSKVNYSRKKTAKIFKMVRKGIRFVLNSNTRNMVVFI